MSDAARLSFDLLEVDLRDPEAVASLVFRHAVQPCYAIYEGHHLSFALGTLQPIWSVDPSPATLEPALRGLVLAQGVFPGALRAGGWDASRPGQDLPSWTLLLAVTQMRDLVWAARTILGNPGERPQGPCLVGPVSDSSGIDALARAKTLVETALLPPVDGDATEPVAREEVGLEAIDAVAADELDAVLMADVQTRLVRITDIEPVLAVEQYDHPDAPDRFEPLRVERGVFPATLPTSILGLVVHDLVETFRLGRRTGVCAFCRRPFLLESQQASLARRGKAVYHPGCFTERRRRYMRDYRATQRDPVNSTSALSVSTDGS